jgi:hypothetical protein
VQSHLTLSFNPNLILKGTMRRGLGRGLRTSGFDYQKQSGTMRRGLGRGRRTVGFDYQKQSGTMRRGLGRGLRTSGFDYQKQSGTMRRGLGHGRRPVGFVTKLKKIRLARPSHPLCWPPRKGRLRHLQVSMNL